MSFHMSKILILKKKVLRDKGQHRRGAGVGKRGSGPSRAWAGGVGPRVLCVRLSSWDSEGGSHGKACLASPDDPELRPELRAAAAPPAVCTAL